MVVMYYTTPGLAIFPQLSLILFILLSLSIYFLYIAHFIYVSVVQWHNKSHFERILQKIQL